MPRGVRLHAQVADVIGVSAAKAIEVRDEACSMVHLSHDALTHYRPLLVTCLPCRSPLTLTSPRSRQMRNGSSSHPPTHADPRCPRPPSPPPQQAVRTLPGTKDPKISREQNAMSIVRRECLLAREYEGV